MFRGSKFYIISLYRRYSTVLDVFFFIRNCPNENQSRVHPFKIIKSNSLNGGTARTPYSSVNFVIPLTAKG